MVYNEKIKEQHYKWRKANIEQYRDYVNKGCKKFYEQHKEELNEKSLKRYYLKKEFQVFRNILL
jgi:hypothetical protein